MSERLEQIRPMAERGMSGSEIAKAVGSTRSAICGFCHRQGIKLQGRGGRPRKGGFQIVNASGSKFSDKWLEEEGR